MSVPFDIPGARIDADNAPISPGANCHKSNLERYNNAFAEDLE